jgi:DNA-directed RNA polymerase subunit RPC12/RpoP
MRAFYACAKGPTVAALCDPVFVSWCIAARFSTTGEAETARSALDAAAIDSFLADEEIIAIDWLFSNAVGGVKLIVREEDRESSEALLSGVYDEEPFEESVGQAVAEVPREETVRCPSCGSTEVGRVPRLRLFFFFALVLGSVGYAVERKTLAFAVVMVVAVVLALIPSRWCTTCGEKFDPRSPEPPPPDPSDVAGRFCPRCGSPEFHSIDYQRLKMVPLLISVAILIVLPLWLFLPKQKCDACGFASRLLPS